MIRVKHWPPGYHLEFPRHADHVRSAGTGVTLTRDEAYDLLDKLRTVLAATLSLSGSRGQ